MASVAADNETGRGLLDAGRNRPKAEIQFFEKTMEAIYLAITPMGVQSALRAAAAPGATVWCGADAMSELEFEAHLGSNVTRFTYSLGDASQADVAGAIETIREHHPSAIIWVESQG